MEFRGHTDALKDESVVTINYRIIPFGSSDTRLPESNEIPPCVGRFRVLGEIARGGMGVVLRAYDADLDRELAIKVLSPGIAPGSEAGRRFAQEARVVSQLNHPGILPVFESGVLPDGRAYFAMPYVQGETLACHLARRSSAASDLDHWLAVFERVCSVIAYVHAERVIHCDLKPSNIMVDRFGEVVVMDWGVAVPLGPLSRESLDDQGCWVFGTPAYMPPEQARGRAEAADSRCDVFGLGAILCEILTGEPPYVGPDVSVVTRLAADGAQAETAQRLNECRADAELIDLVRRCLAPNPADRPADASAVRREISAYRNPPACVIRPLREEPVGGFRQRWAELLTAALALTASAAVGAAANQLNIRAMERAGSPDTPVELKSTERPSDRP